MKKFKGHRTLDQVQQACQEQGLGFDRTAYDEGNDYVRIIGTFAGISVVLYYSSWNGKFMGTLPSGVTFDSDSDEHDGLPWFDALLEFFYVEEIK